MSKRRKHTPYADALELKAEAVTEFLNLPDRANCRPVRNFSFLSHPNIATKAAVSEITGRDRRTFHGYNAVLALMELGFKVSAKRTYPANTAKGSELERYRKAGMLRFDDLESERRKKVASQVKGPLPEPRRHR